MSSMEPRFRRELRELFEGPPEVRRARREEFRWLAEIMRKMKDGDKAAQPSVRALAKLGWTIPLWGPIPLTEMIIEKVAPAEIDSFFVRTYRRSNYKVFRQMLRKMKENPVLVQWRSLLEECASVFRQHHYLIVVPSLLLILEGVLSFPPGAPKRKVRVPSESRRRLAKSELLWTNTWLSISTFLGEVFKGHEFDRERPGLINRHWILHGRDETNWTEADCLRLFQSIDTLSYAIAVRLEQKSGAA